MKRLFVTLLLLAALTTAQSNVWVADNGNGYVDFDYFRVEQTNE